MIHSNSNQRLKLNINGKSYLVEVDDPFASPIMVKVNGQPYQVDIETDRVQKIPAAEAVAASETVAARMPAPRQAPAPAIPTGATGQEVRAPMPGHIVDIVVGVGDEVSVGQELCSLEAMKMKNAIRSHRDGVIASVAATPGQAVAHGDILFTFE